MIEDMLFVPQKDISILDIKDGLEERFMQVSALLNYILTDAPNTEPRVAPETTFSTIWLIERLVNEIRVLDERLFEQVLK